MTFNFLGPGLTVNVEAKVKEQIILDSSVKLNIPTPIRSESLSNMLISDGIFGTRIQASY